MTSFLYIVTESYSEPFDHSQSDAQESRTYLVTAGVHVLCPCSKKINNFQKQIITRMYELRRSQVLTQIGIRYVLS